MSTGWRARILSAGAGTGAALALPPHHLLAVLPVCFGVLAVMLHGRTGLRGAFGIGWWFGVGHFTAGFHWIGHSFLVPPATFAWLMPAAIGGMAMGLALFPALACLLAWRLGTGPIGRTVWLIAGWSLTEWLRGHVLTGFPWNLIASVWAFDAAPLQITALIGAYGLGLLTLPFALLPVLAIGHGRAGRRLALAGLLSPVLLWGYGLWRLHGAPDPDTDRVPGIRLRLVQPNIAQEAKWRRELLDAHIAALLLGTGREPVPTAPDATRVVIWPETALPFDPIRDETRRRTIAGALGPRDVLLSGAIRLAFDDGQRLRAVWNSLLAITPDGGVAAGYDKTRLVPFGEYVPLKNWLPIRKMTAGRVDFSPGRGIRTIAVRGIPPFSPLICYEGIFPAGVTEAGNRPHWLLNITNDAWFGDSAGPHQHLAATRLRAIEEGLPLVRVANTGISAVYDAHGRTRARLDPMEAGAIDTVLPVRLSGSSLYSEWGDTAFWFMLLCIAAGSLPWRPIVAGRIR